MDFKYEIGGEKVAKVEHEFLYYEEDKGTHTYFVEADKIFKYFLLEILEKHGIENYWQGESVALKIDDGDRVWIYHLQEAKEKLEIFFGKGKEKEAKEEMFLKNEELFKNIYELNY